MQIEEKTTGERAAGAVKGGISGGVIGGVVGGLAGLAVAGALASAAGDAVASMLPSPATVDQLATEVSGAAQAASETQPVSILDTSSGLIADFKDAITTTGGIVGGGAMAATGATIGATLGWADKIKLEREQQAHMPHTRF